MRGEDIKHETRKTSFFEQLFSWDFFPAFLLLMVGFTTQTYIIFPIELLIRTDGFVEYASVVFIPHGLKILILLVYGIRGLPAIFIAQNLNGIMLFETINLEIFMSAIAGTICVGLPLILHNLSFGKRYFYVPISEPKNSLSIFWLFCSWALISSFINSLFHSLIYGFPATNLPWLFMIGDVSGAIVLSIASILVLRFFFKGQK